MKKLSSIIRASIGIAVIVIFAVFFGIRLMKIQIVDGAKYLSMSHRSTTAVQTVPAVRGGIVDSKGRALVENKVSYNVIIEYSFFPDDLQEQNEAILRIARLLEGDGLTWIDETPITFDQPYEYLPEAKESDISRIIKKLRLNSYATAENCISKLIEDFEISPDYTERERRIIAGVRYQMILADFSSKTDYVYIKNVPIETASKVHELKAYIPGADIAEDAVRVYTSGEVFPHGIGYVGPIYAEEYEQLRDKGYLISDTVGKSGIEKAMEDVLRGKSGEKTITASSDGAVSEEITLSQTPGSTVMLTIDSQFQSAVQNILETHIGYLNQGMLTKRDNVTKEYLDFSECKSGAAVVMDVKTGAVLALATAPGYDINDLLEDYSAVLNADGAPLYNRATDGLYRPGSVMKTVTAIAALNEGIITPEEKFHCARHYTFLDIIVNCTGSHGNINVTTAIQKSCNIFFYQVVQKLGLDKLMDYQQAFGLATEQQLEISSTKGYLACPETFENLGLDWTVGQVLQAAIGQSEVGVTPLQMCVLASTIANRGVRLKPYLIDSVWDYNMQTMLSKTAPKTVSKIDADPNAVFQPVIDGMILAGESTTSQIYSSSNSQAAFEAQFSTTALPKKVAIKTGTPQAGNKATQNSTVVGFYPADDPEIAFAVVIEGGEYAKYTVRKIIEAYYGYETGTEDIGGGRMKSVAVPRKSGSSQAATETN